MWKRLFDLVASALLLLVLALPMAALALLVWIRLGRPVLFCQRRPGRHGRPFRLCKFRTMLDRTDGAGEPLPDEERITPFGQWLRRTSLDELPELWNVLKGEMSLVGPRPLLMEYLSLYTPEQARRHEVRPGITGWAQVNGRNALDWDERLRMDVWYVDHRSFLLDLRILWLTLFKVVSSEGVTQEGHVTVERFRGSDK
ncbi:MAG TPA: sugar transferase [Sedimenticola thiotaurini]|uniref:Sugar transferase n=1 Tax=Sedimenticola thiotaurini TaxID=1543721 RepID=A0A831RMQ7_9GAMM|nr:sugar transferase [Sedimenticola thiotaurini]